VTTYTSLDGDTHDAGEEVQRIQTERTGTPVGNWEPTPPQTDEPYAPEHAQAPEPTYEPQHDDYDPELEQLVAEDSYDDNVFGREGWVEPDPHADLRSVIREELGVDNFDTREYDDWDAQRDAHLVAKEAAAEAQFEEMTRGAVAASVGEATGGRLGEWADGVNEQVASAVAQDWLDARANAQAYGLSEDQVDALFVQNFDAVAKGAWQNVRSQNATASCLREFRAHFTRDR
jgi:hypothetical protein